MNTFHLLLCRSTIPALLASTPLFADVVEYHLTIEEQTLAPAGRSVSALTINGQLSGPVLSFREGDTARVLVHNRLREETLIHWHGVLVPNDQDGVPHITTPPVPPGQSFTYQFPLHQAGTYWYHSHSGLQQQRGTLGAIVITPRGGEPVQAASDHVLLFSDWTNESPGEVQRTLARGSSYYALRKGNQQSLLGALKAGAWQEYWEREKSRMPAMDVSDVAYDAFLINGERQHQVQARAGERVRLRLINGGASTYFYAESATGPLTIIAADGRTVEPLQIQRLLIANGETYDVLVTLPASGAWELRATAQDGSGYATAWLGQGTRHPAPQVPGPDLYRMDEMLMGAMDHEAEPQSGGRPPSPAPRLRAAHRAQLKQAAAVTKMELRLTGDMERYIWSFNGKTMTEESTIPVKRGESLRLEMVNDTMMHHPIHLHGFFFRVLNGQGDRSPWKHTIDVPPMARRTIEFEANELGDWMFHCHLLYHMMAGMGRVVRVTESPAADAQAHAHDHAAMGEHGMDPWYLFVDGTAQSHMTDGSLNWQRGRDNVVARWEAGWLDSSDDSYELDLTYERYFNPNVIAFLGARLTADSEAGDRAIAGVRYRLPWLIDSSLGVDSRGGIRIGLGKTFQLTDRLSLFSLVHYDTRTELEWQAGLHYTLTKQLSLVGQYHSDYGLGAGLGFRF